MRLWRRSARPRPWRGSPTLKMRVRNPDNPDFYLPLHEVTVMPRVLKGVPRVGLRVQNGAMAGTVSLTEGETRTLARALIEAIEESASIAARGPDDQRRSPGRS